MAQWVRDAVKTMRSQVRTSHPRILTRERITLSMGKPTRPQSATVNTLAPYALFFLVCVKSPRDHVAALCGALPEGSVAAAVVEWLVAGVKRLSPPIVLRSWAVCGMLELLQVDRVVEGPIVAWRGFTSTESTVLDVDEVATDGDDLDEHPDIPSHLTDLLPADVARGARSTCRDGANHQPLRKAARPPPIPDAEHL
jgi:hypothetical protein